MKVHEVMSQKTVTVSPKTKLAELWEIIFKKNVRGVPVVDAKNRLMGIVAEEDLLKRLYPNYEEYIEDFVSAADFEEMEERLSDLIGLTAEDLMSKKVIFTRKNTPILRALSRMILRSVHQLPVISENNEVIGVISKSDIFDILFAKRLRGKFKAKNKSKK